MTSLLKKTAINWIFLKGSYFYIPFNIIPSKFSWPGSELKVVL